MSTAWGYKCVTCNKSEPYLVGGGNSPWQRENLRKLHVAYPPLKTVLDDGRCSHLTIQIAAPFFRSTEIALKFLDAHYNHKIIRVSEYGDEASLEL